MKVKTLVQRRGDRPECTLCWSTAGLTIDHIHPRAKGGTDAISNYMILCSTCNTFKDDQTLEEMYDKLNKVMPAVRMMVIARRSAIKEYEKSKTPKTTPEVEDHAPLVAFLKRLRRK